MNKKTPNNFHLRERLISSAIDMPEEPGIEMRNECTLWLIFSAIVNVVLILILIVNFKLSNRSLTHQQEQKLDVAIERMTEVTDFIKVHSYDPK